MNANATYIVSKTDARLNERVEVIGRRDGFTYITFGDGTTTKVPSAWVEEDPEPVPSLRPMGALPSLGLRFNASLVRDRETDKLYALHTDRCEAAFESAMRDAGIDILSRFAPMGPTRLESGESCNWGGCDHA